MIKKLFVLGILFCIASNLSIAQVIPLNKENLNRPLAHKIQIFEDGNHEYSVEDFYKENKGLEFKQLNRPIEVIDFNTSRWFVKFELTNEIEEHLSLILETARPITSRVDLYQINGDSITLLGKSGNEIKFEEKVFPHRKSLFPIQLEKAETSSFILVMESDGEVINMPFTFWEKHEFHRVDYRNQLFHGFYFGVLAFVVFIFFFFYLLLRDKSFLYYIIYVFFQFMLQFSLEGFSSQYIFPSAPFWGNNAVLMSAIGGSFFVILYATAFLKLKKRTVFWKKYFRTIKGLILLVIITTFIPGTLHALSYPIINVLSMIGILSILLVIVHLSRRGFEVNKAFTVGFIIFVIGVVVFILGNLGVITDAMLSELALKVGAGLEVLALSISMAGKYQELQQEKEKAQEKALENLEAIVEKRTEEVNKQKSRIESQHKDIVSSIQYAQRIQGAFLPEEEELDQILKDYFILFLPRDIVSGDFYFAKSVTTNTGNKVDIFAAVDCTGHGVPGAFMSFLGNNFLKQSTKSDDVNNPAEALDFLNKGILDTLKIEESIKKGDPIRDGMDMTLCGFNRSKNKLYFAGAKNSILLITDAKNEQNFNFSEDYIKGPLYSDDKQKILIEIKGDRHPIGLYGEDSIIPFTNREFDINKGDIVYSYSDGYIDQFGGKRNKKFGTKRFKKLLLDIYKLPMKEQKLKLNQTLEDWKGDIEALDDIIVMGVKY